MTEPTGRRRKIVPISAALMHELFVENHKPIALACTQGLPRDARFMGHDYEAQRDIHYLVFESDTWDLVPFNEQLPIFIIQYTRFSGWQVVE